MEVDTSIKDDENSDSLSEKEKEEEIPDNSPHVVVFHDMGAQASA